jgi:hypothetical protein
VTVKVTKGDRVRVVLEGEVRSVERDADFVIGPMGVDNFITQSAKHVVRIEVLAKQFKVGDTISGDDYAQLPVGTVLSSFDILTHKVGNDRWASRWGDCSSEYLGGPRKIAFLP